MSAPVLRPPELADAPAMAAAMIAGLEVYRAFAPAGWRAPAAAEEEAHLRTLLADPHVWACVADDGGRIVGQVTTLPAARASRPVGEPGLMHLRNLFVDAELWGSGLATALHDAAMGAAAQRGFTAIRLFVATGQARARGFYVREGWREQGAPFFEPALGFELVEMRRPVS